MALEEGIYTKRFPLSAKDFRRLNQDFQSLLIYLEKYYDRTSVIDYGIKIPNRFSYYRFYASDTNGSLYIVIDCTICNILPPLSLFLSAGIYRVLDKENIKYLSYNLVSSGEGMIYDLGDGFISRSEIEKAISDFEKSEKMHQK